MVMRNLRGRLLNVAYSREDGPPLRIRLFRWLIPPSEILRGVVVSQAGGDRMLVRVGRRDVMVSRSLLHEPVEACPDGADPDCGHWRPAESYEAGDRVLVMRMAPSPELPVDSYFDIGPAAAA